MAITHFLLQSNCQQTFHSRPLCSFPTKWSSCALKRNQSPCCIKTSHKTNIKCFVKVKWEHGFDENRGGEGGNIIKKNATETGINEVIWRSMENVVKALQVPVITGVLLGLLFSFDHRQRPAMAASGGRIGGSSFSSESYSSSSSSSYSSPSSSTSYYSSDSYSDDTYSTQIRSPAPMRAADEVQPIGFHVAAIATCVILFYIIWYIDDRGTAKTSVLKLQVGSLGTGRSLQRYLNRIAESADTSTSKGFNYVLQGDGVIYYEAILALLRHSDYCISAYSSVDVKRSVKECEKLFNQLSIEERGKFDEETLVNVNNIRKKSATSQSSNGLQNEYIVVTIIVAANDVPELPPIKSNAQLKKALQKLASIPSSNIMGAEVLWTPQIEDDSLTEQEMLKDYPMLRPL